MRVSVRLARNRARSLWVALLSIAVLGVPAASFAVIDTSQVRVHAVTETGFGTRRFDISAGPGPTGTVTITEPAPPGTTYPGTVSCLVVNGADAIVGAVLTQGGSPSLQYAVVLRIHDDGPGGTGDTITEEAPWATNVAPDCNMAALSAPMPVVSGWAAVGDTSDGGPGSVSGSAVLDLGSGQTQSFDIAAERSPGGSVTGAVSMTFSTGPTSYAGTIDCLSIFGPTAVVGATMTQVSGTQVLYTTFFLTDGGFGGTGDLASFNAPSNFQYPDCAAAQESASSGLLSGDITVSSGPLTSPEPSQSATPTPTPTPTATATLPPPPPTMTPTATPPGPPPPPTPAPTAPPPATAGDFVTANGRELELAGQPYRFTGINMYNAASDGWCNFAYDDTTFGAALDEIGLGGGEVGVIRAWFFQPQAIDKATDTPTWERLDRVLRIAADKGYRVIPTLTDQWGECGSDAANGFKTIDWYTDGYKAVDPGMLIPYRQWVQEVVTRYRDDPTILAWQLINEGEVKTSDTADCPADDSHALVFQTWASDISNLVRSIDTNHLISLGTIGGGQCGTNMTQFQDVHALPNIDLCEVHDYSGAGAPPIYGDPFNGLQTRIDQCAALNKPLFVGEVGIGDGIGLGARADGFLQKLAYQANAGIVGHLAWGWQTTEQFAIQAGDPALEVLAEGPYRVVTTNGDVTDGLCELAGCSLREAITASNAGPGKESIRFDLPVGAASVMPLTGLPPVAGTVVVDGRALPGDVSPGAVTLTGTFAGASTVGLTVTGSGVTIQGLTIRDFSGSGVRIPGHDNLIGGTEPGDGNRIIDNGADGVTIVDEVNPNTAVGNAILGNVITGNVRLGINLGDHEASELPTVGFPVGGNWPPTGPNRHQLPPMLQPTTPGATTIDGVMAGRIGETNRIEAFWAPDCLPGRPQAALFLGAVDVSFPNASGPPVPFSLAVPSLVAGFLTATTTNVLGDTSELAACVPVRDPVDLRTASLVVSPDPAGPGGLITATVTIQNQGPGIATNVVAGIGWAPEVAITVDSVSGGADCTPIETAAICSFAVIAAGGIGSVTVAFRTTTLGPLDLTGALIMLGDTDPGNDVLTATMQVLDVAATDAGDDIEIAVSDPDMLAAPIEMMFDTVTGAGVTTLDISDSGPTLPAGFKLGVPPTYYGIETTATFTGQVQVCITYDQSDYADEGAIRLFHYDTSLAAWEDSTTSLDTSANRVCGITTSLSPFAAVERSFRFTGFYAPVDNLLVLNKVKAGSAIPVKFSLGGNHGYDIFRAGFPTVTAITCPNATVDALESTASASANALSYDAVTDRYTYVFKSDKALAGSCRELILKFSDGTERRAQFWFTK